MKFNKLYFKIGVYFVAFVLLIFLSTLFLLQARKEHREFENFKTLQKIEKDMPIGFVIKKFGISENEIYKELQLPNNHWNQRYTINQVCKKNKLDCDIVIDNLNKKITR